MGVATGLELDRFDLDLGSQPHALPCNVDANNAARLSTNVLTRFLDPQPL